jgi:hypothetical protein
MPYSLGSGAHGGGALIPHGNSEWGATIPGTKQPRKTLGDCGF